MIYQILLVLCYWIYFGLGEGVTEAMTWKANWTTWEINPRTYHIYRVLENLGLIGVILLIGLKYPSEWLILSLLSAVSGLVIYERIFCLVRYDDFFYKKSSKWLGVGRLPVWVEILIFFIAVGLIIQVIL